MKLFLILTLLCSNAFAIKEVGGGSGSKGTVTDRQVYGAGTVVNGMDLLTLVRARFAKQFATFPELDVLSGRVLIDAHRKTFYIDERPLPAACQNQPAAGVPVEAWACQDLVSVRLYGPTWRGLSNEAKADLIFHEVLTSVALLNPHMPVTFAYVSAAFAALVNPSLTSDQVQREWLRIGFGYLPTLGDWSVATQEMKSFASALCSAQTVGQRAMIAFDRGAKVQSLSANAETQLWIGQTYLEINSKAREWATCDFLSRHVNDYLWSVWYTQMAASSTSAN